MRRRLFVISNAGAGRTSSSLIADTVEALQKAGATVTRAQPSNFAETRTVAEEAARAGGYDAIVAAGGDGTIRHVAAALMGRDVPLGILPTGTGNVLSHEIGLARTPDGIARMLLDGPVVEAVCAHANGEPFLLMAGAGFDAQVLKRLDHGAKGRVGKAAYIGPLMGALLRPLDALKVVVDGRTHEAAWAVVTNACHYGGGFVLTPNTDIHKRGLEAILFKPKSRAGLIGLLISVARGQLKARAGRSGDVEMIACTRVQIDGAQVPIQVDGDVMGTTPVEIDAGTAHVKLIVPAGPRTAAKSAA